MSDSKEILAAKREGYVMANVDRDWSMYGKVSDRDLVRSYEESARQHFPDPYTPGEVEYGGMRYRIDEAGLPQQSVGSMWVGFDIDITDVPLQLLVIFGDLAREYLAHRDGARA